MPLSKPSSKPSNPGPGPGPGKPTTTANMPTLSPLQQIKQETKAANRSPHLRKASQPKPDQIDALDNIGPGGPYHHGGPYDATLASRNQDARYAPLAAVEESNRAALRATPAVNILDALTHHVPLQGTATVPPGATDASGNVMCYEEGADLMREPDAGGGAYRRYEHVTYRPGDLKGKGEPSYSTERDLKAKKKRARRKEKARK
ncbi:hypothetical protein GGR50DRAFT_648957 [Xylaria sp. CBS 124048]|nr:hypothetical protein GGR50DRAFT_648957 [Xylaria sp. CBS 124048]